MVIYFSLKASINFLFRINKERQINPRADTMRWKFFLGRIMKVISSKLHPHPLLAQEKEEKWQDRKPY